MQLEYKWDIDPDVLEKCMADSTSIMEDNDNYIPALISDDVWGVPKQMEQFDSRHDSNNVWHFPYDSFDNFLIHISRLLRDSKYTNVVMSIYRTDGTTSPIVQQLITASKHVKIKVIIEMNAKGDRWQNDDIRTMLLEAGIDVVSYAAGRRKFHAKVFGIWREGDNGEISDSVAFVATGNWNSITAKTYEDYVIRIDDAKYSKNIIDRVLNCDENPVDIDPRILQSRYNARDILIEKINEQKSKKKWGVIKIKCNSLDDPQIIKALNSAAIAGCKIDLIVRGAMCWQPDLVNLNDNVHVHRFIHEYLDHSRVYYIGTDMYIGSLDLVQKKFDNRFELLVKVEDDEIRQGISSYIHTLLQTKDERHLMMGDDYHYHHKTTFTFGGGNGCKKRT